jgi:hypothetical protein
MKEPTNCGECKHGKFDLESKDIPECNESVAKINFTCLKKERKEAVVSCPDFEQK